MQVSKFTLTGGKEVYFREPKISDTDYAAQVAGKQAGPDNQAHLGVLLQKEIVKLLLVRINTKDISVQEKQDIDKLFTYKEYNEVQKAVQMLTGTESGNSVELTPEFVDIGKE